MRAKRIWALIADGGAARVYALHWPGPRLAAIAGLDFAEETGRWRDIVTDRPGRAFDSQGHSRHAMAAPTDLRAAAKEAFLAHVVEALAARADAFDALILAAPPRALGALRASLPDSLAARLLAELPKDLMKIPLADLPAHFAEVAG